MGYYAAERKKELPLFMITWMDLESIMLSETSQAVKDKYHDLTYKSNLISKTNKKVTRGEVGGDNEGERGKGHQGRCIKDTWTKPKGGRIEGGRWGSVSYTHLTLPTTGSLCRSRWSPYH